MLVGPRSPSAVGADHLENRVHLYELVRVHRGALAIGHPQRQLRGIDLRQRLPQRAADGCRGRVDVEIFRIDGLGAGRAGAVGAGREQRAVEGIVVEYTVDFEVPPVTWASSPGNESEGAVVSALA